MTKVIVKKFLNQIGFYDSDIHSDFETNFVLAINQVRGGFILRDHSARFSSLRSLKSHLEKYLGVKANRVGRDEFDFNINVNINKYFDYMVIYKENDDIKIFLRKKKNAK